MSHNFTLPRIQISFECQKTDPAELKIRLVEKMNNHHCKLVFVQADASADDADAAVAAAIRPSSFFNEIDFSKVLHFENFILALFGSSLLL